MDPPQEMALGKRLFAGILLGAAFVVIAFFIQAPSKNEAPDKPLTIEAIHVGATEILFNPLTISEATKHEVHLAIEPHPKEYTLQLKTESDLPLNPAQQVIKFNPAVNLLNPRIYVADKSGSEWDLYPTQIIFEWRTLKENPIYQKFVKSRLPYPLFRFRPSKISKVSSLLQPQGPYASIKCVVDKGDNCPPISLRDLFFFAPIEVIEITDQIPK